MNSRTNKTQEEKYTEARELLVNALLNCSAEIAKLAQQLKDGTLPLMECEEALIQSIQRCIGDVM